MKKQYLASEPR